ncbi:hypothetical protein P3T37_002889 [Kitasatospora sp. MAA4]|uniref:hypothetical protein n=1 Tax=Kitasatospora sp. MAA4 TaxID=3035093 RepID=UPI002476B941|nr:hypothetical protein [Kitasatospora sp. MAA4]MDH6133493.1 hypothetical protein [Kitasatospora sp. MAA4]
MTDETRTYCAVPASDGPDALAALTPAPDQAGPRADCVLCGEPTEFPADRAGSTLCPVCAWQQAQRIACAG